MASQSVSIRQTGLCWYIDLVVTRILYNVRHNSVNCVMSREYNGQVAKRPINQTAASRAKVRAANYLWSIFRSKLDIHSNDVKFLPSNQKRRKWLHTTSSVGLYDARSYKKKKTKSLAYISGAGIEIKTIRYMSKMPLDSMKFTMPPMAFCSEPFCLDKLL